MSIDVDANNYIIKLQYASLKLFQIIIVINIILYTKHWQLKSVHNDNLYLVHLITPLTLLRNAIPLLNYMQCIFYPNIILECCIFDLYSWNLSGHLDGLPLTVIIQFLEMLGVILLSSVMPVPAKTKWIYNDSVLSKGIGGLEPSGQKQILNYSKTSLSRQVEIL